MAHLKITTPIWGFSNMVAKRYTDFNTCAFSNEVMMVQVSKSEDINVILVTEHKFSKCQNKKSGFSKCLTLL